MSCVIFIGDPALVRSVQKAAAKQDLTVDALVERLLQRCDDLDLLEKVVCNGPLSPELESRR